MRFRPYSCFVFVRRHWWWRLRKQNHDVRAKSQSASYRRTTLTFIYIYLPSSLIRDDITLFSGPRGKLITPYCNMPNQIYMFDVLLCPFKQQHNKIMHFGPFLGWICLELFSTISNLTTTVCIIAQCSGEDTVKLP